MTRRRQELVVTTETPGGHLTRLALVTLRAIGLGAVAFALLASGLIVEGLPWGAALLVAGLIALAAAFVILPALSWCLEMRGTWRLDERGITFDPSVGRSRHAAWRDVERVRVEPHGLRLRRGRGRLTVDAGLLDGPTWTRLRGEIVARLGQRFELPEPAPASSWIDRRRAPRSRVLLRAATFAAIASFTALLCAGGAVWPLIFAAVAGAARLAADVAIRWHSPWLEPATPGAG